MKKLNQNIVNKPESLYRAEFDELFNRIEQEIQKVKTSDAWAGFQNESRVMFVTHPIFVSDCYAEVFTEKCLLLGQLFNLKVFVDKTKKLVNKGKVSKEEYSYFKLMYENIERRVSYVLNF